MRTSRRQQLNSTGVYHKLWRGHNDEWVLRTGEEKETYLRALARTRVRATEESVKWHSYCVMSNHSHETGRVVTTVENCITKLGNWMRSAHSQYGAWYNRKHERKGKVAYDRPKTLEIEDDTHLMTAMIYGDCNPVRAGMVRHPSQYRYSSYRFYAHGERSEFTGHLEQPGWYTALGSTPSKRQARYRRIVDEYLRTQGFINDQVMLCGGRFIGTRKWVQSRRADLQYLVRNRHGPP